MEDLRPDLQRIVDLIKPHSRVLDLGCGEGTLLAALTARSLVHGYGLEIDRSKITRCIAIGVNAIYSNIETSLERFDDNSFDYVVMTHALQMMHRPERLLEQMLRIGREGFVTFPNFAHWRCRVHLAVHGRMPVTRSLPAAWFETRNIHLCTVRDFEALCAVKQIRIMQRTMVDMQHRPRWWMRIWPNLLGQTALYQITREGER